MAVQIFRRLLELDYEHIKYSPKAIEDEVVISFWNNPEEAPLIDQSFQDIYTLFNRQLRGLNTNYDYKHNEAVQSMISLILFQGFEESPVVIEQDFDDNILQTFNVRSWSYAKAIIKRPSNLRKASSDTTY